MSDHKTTKIDKKLFAERANTGLVGRYVQALTELAHDGKILPQIAQDCDKLARLLREVPELRRVISDPTWTHQALVELMQKVTAPLKLSELMQKFLGLVVAKGRLPYLLAMLDEFAAEYRRQSGEIEAEIVTATSLSKTQSDLLQKELEQQLGVKISMTHHIDAKLIGGLVLRIGTWMVDFSLQNKLNRLQHILQQEGA
ncbi:MAG: ATP synthase F1 subunit delta [Alphaproteobacteria bacterium]|nr:ATP synthase F1 subunit delta [Alphaproteobacteria bacterium]